MSKFFLKPIHRQSILSLFILMTSPILIGQENVSSSNDMDYAYELIGQFQSQACLNEQVKIGMAMDELFKLEPSLKSMFGGSEQSEVSLRAGCNDNKNDIVMFILKEGKAVLDTIVINLQFSDDAARSDKLDAFFARYGKPSTTVKEQQSNNILDSLVWEIGHHRLIISKDADVSSKGKWGLILRIMNNDVPLSSAINLYE